MTGNSCSPLRRLCGRRCYRQSDSPSRCSRREWTRARSGGSRLLRTPCGAEDTDGRETARALASLKARRVSAGAPGAFVIGADQLLVCGEEWFDKPVDVEDARGQLKRLRGRRHTLVTAVCVVRDEAEIWSDVACPQLTMRPFSDTFLERYLARAGDGILACVGGYEAEGLGAQLLAKIEGDWFAVLGLPLMPLLAFLREHGLVET